MASHFCLAALAENTPRRLLLGDDVTGTTKIKCIESNDIYSNLMTDPLVFLFHACCLDYSYLNGSHTNCSKQN